MPQHINLSTRYARRVRPPQETLAPWAPGPGGQLVLFLLGKYRYLTRDLLALAYHHYRGAGTEEVKNHLTRLWRHGYVERFYRPTEMGLGSRQYVYVIRPEGVQALLSPAELPENWATHRFQVYNRLKPKSAGYEHALSVSLFQMLWDLGAPAVASQLETLAYWIDREGSRDRKGNSFRVVVDGAPVRLYPDTTIWARWSDRRGVQPLFVEIERSHKNHKRLTAWFRAYQALLTDQHDAARTIFRRDVGLVETLTPGAVLFVAADHAARDRMRSVAAETVGAVSRNNPRVPDFWFTSLEDLFERHEDGREAVIPPAELFHRKLALNLAGKPWALI